MDGVFQPNGAATIISTNSKTLSANNTTAVVPIWTITGSIHLIALWGVVTTTLGANNTAASWRINDSGAQTYLTAIAGTTLSALPSNTIIAKRGALGTALVAITSASANISEGVAAETIYFSPVLINQKTGAVTTNLEFRYTTTDTPTSGVIQFFAEWKPISANAAVTAV